MKKHYYYNDILEICTNRHLTADEIYEKLKKRYPQVGLSTVYRNVEELTNQGKLKKITNIGKKAVFEKNKWYHAHIYDEEKKLIKDIDLSEINLPIPENFEISDIDITIKWKFKNY